QLVERRDAVQAGHHDVDDRRIERDGAGQLQPFGPGGGQPHLVAFTRQERLEDLTHDLFVVDDEDRAAAGRWHLGQAGYTRRLLRTAAGPAIGSANVKRVPCPTVLSHRMAPSCSLTMP